MGCVGDWKDGGRSEKGKRLDCGKGFQEAGDEPWCQEGRYPGTLGMTGRGFLPSLTVCLLLCCFLPVVTGPVTPPVSGFPFVTFLVRSSSFSPGALVAQAACCCEGHRAVGPHLDGARCHR